MYIFDRIFAFLLYLREILRSYRLEIHFIQILCLHFMGFDLNSSNLEYSSFMQNQFY